MLLISAKGDFFLQQSIRSVLMPVSLSIKAGTLYCPPTTHPHPCSVPQVFVAFQLIIEWLLRLKMVMDLGFPRSDNAFCQCGCVVGFG